VAEWFARPALLQLNVKVTIIINYQQQETTILLIKMYDFDLGFSIFLEGEQTYCHNIAGG